MSPFLTHGVCNVRSVKCKKYQVSGEYRQSFNAVLVTQIVVVMVGNRYHPAFRLTPGYV